MVSSAAASVFPVGAFITTMPLRLATGTLTLSTPTPARAMTLRFTAAFSASSSIFVPLRVRTASISGSLLSRSSRDIPTSSINSMSGASLSIRSPASPTLSATSTFHFLLTSAMITDPPCSICSRLQRGSRLLLCPPYRRHRRGLQG